MRRLLCPAVAVLLSLPALLAPSAAQEKPDVEKFVTARPGTLPIILSAPHGGRIPVPGVPTRKGIGAKLFVIARDENTAGLTERIAAGLEKRLGGKPYVVIARFERKQADANRPAEDAYEDPRAKAVYDAYHETLKNYTTEVRKQWGRGLLLDVHGQTGRLSAVVRGTQNYKTCKDLKDRFGVKAVTGPDSIFGVLAKKGYEVFPPVDDPDAREDPRYSGGYIVRAYGSDAGTGIDAIQLEFGGKLRTFQTIDRTAADAAEAIATFAKAYLPAEKVK